MEALKKKVLSLLYSEVTCLIVTQAKDGILVTGGDYDALASRTRATGGRRGVDVKKGEQTRYTRRSCTPEWAPSESSQ